MGHRVAQLECDGDDGVGKVCGDHVRCQTGSIATVTSRFVEFSAKDGLDVVCRVDLDQHVEITPVDGHDALEARLSGRARVVVVDARVGHAGAGPPEVEDVGDGAGRRGRGRESANAKASSASDQTRCVQGQCEFKGRAVEAYGGGAGGGGSEGGGDVGGAEGGMNGHVQAKTLPASTGSTVSVTSARSVKSETPKPPVAWRRRRPADAAMVVEATHAW